MRAECGEREGIMHWAGRLVGIDVVNDCLMNIQAHKISGAQRGHCSTREGSENRIDVIDAPAIGVLLRELHGSIDELEANLVSQKSWRISHSHYNAMEHVIQVRLHLCLSCFAHICRRTELAEPHGIRRVEEVHAREEWAA